MPWRLTKVRLLSCLVFPPRRGILQLDTPFNVTMAQLPKPAAELMWAYQLQREHRHLLERLKALEATSEEQNNLLERLKALEATSKEQDSRIKASQGSISSDVDAKIAALAQRIKSLENSEFSEQVAGLAHELREVRQQVSRSQEKLKDVEKASISAAGVSRNEHEAVLDRVGDVESEMKGVYKASHQLEQKEQASRNETRAADARVKELSEQLDTAVERFETKLRTLQAEQTELRTLFGRAKVEFEAATSMPKIVSTTVPTHLDDPASKTTLKRAFPPDGEASEKPSRKPRMAWEKEISQLMRGDDSLMSALPISKNIINSTQGATRKRKAEGPPELAPKPVLLMRETRSQAKRLKPLLSESSTRAGKATESQSMPAISARNANIAKSNKSKRPTMLVKLTLPKSTMLPSTSSKEIRRVVPQRKANNLQPKPISSNPAAKGKGKEKLDRSSKNTVPSTSVQKRPQSPAKRPQNRRRHLTQEDDMDEWWAQVQARTGK